ncbi:conserved Plasmodium protein, unknown function [Plasmodium sp. DRC-Itaito]|nr:conserved Plasmodium protein, unknown function [Plasmodium sp. DRC-Itaito]
MKNVLFNGPVIPEIDAGYNVQVNGISVNFLKDPFCFRNAVIENEHYKNKLLYKHFNDNNVNKNITNNIKRKNIDELDKGFNEYIKDRVNNTNVYIKKKNEPDYNLNDVKSPIYKERIKYTPQIIEVIRTNYNVPQNEKVKINKENLIYMNNIEYKKAN